MLSNERHLITLFCKAINEKRLLKFYYESKSGNKDRIIRPYLLCINKKGNLELAGAPIEELLKEIKDIKSGHYLLKGIDNTRVEILSETFADPRVDRKRVVDTPTVKVICRFIYDDEKEEPIRSGWVNPEDQ